MERAAVRRRLTWQFARVVEVVTETARTKSVVLEAADWPCQLAGQHVDVRLTAEDGYQAQRSYSIASAPEDEHLALTVERLDDGEVSPYLTETLRPGDELELRGPIGGYFVWRESLGGPLLLVGGGSGVVPLRAILRHHRASPSEIPARLLYSARTRADLIYRAELADYDTTITLTREQPQGWNGRRGRIDRDLLAEAAGQAPARLPVRPNRIRRGGRRRARIARARTESHPSREIRPDMNRMVALDGNAIAGDLHEVFGVDLTAAKSVCAACGASSFVAEAVVYARCPGRVARCRACGEVLIVLVTIRGITCVDLRGIGELQMET